jgi:hypothetical protein
MPNTDIYTLVSRGTMLEELDRLELGPDPASAWDDAWLVDGELTALPGWEAWGLGGQRGGRHIGAHRWALLKREGTAGGLRDGHDISSRTRDITHR